MLAITPQMRILVAVEAVDFCKYAPPIDMRSFSNQDSEIQALLQREPSCSQVELRIT